jgi:hypothetical protein
VVSLAGLRVVEADSVFYLALNSRMIAKKWEAQNSSESAVRTVLRAAS